MKKLIKLLLITAILMLFSGLIACGDETPDDITPPPAPTNVNKIEYSEQDDGVVITGIRVIYQTDVEIPDTINDKKVIGIAKSAFDTEKKSTYSKITSIKLGAWVTSIGERAFFGCVNLTQITPTTQVESIGAQAFENCQSLSQFALNDKISVIEQRTFAGCKKLEGMDISGVTMIKDGAFFGCGSTVGSFNLTGTNKLTSIGESAFKDCAIKTINLPDTVETIGVYAFQASGLTNIKIPKKITTIASGVFMGCFSLESVTLNSNLSKIDSQAFKNCVRLTTVNFSKSLKTICIEAFANCKLTELTIPDSVNTIESKAFVGCSSLATVVIGKDVRTIGEHAFGDGTADKEATQTLTSLTFLHLSGWHYGAEYPEEDLLEGGRILANTYWAARDKEWRR